MARSSKMMMVAATAALLALALATAEARNIKTAATAASTENKKDVGDAVVQPQTFPPFDRLGGGASPAFGGLPGGSSIPGFSMPGSGSLPGFMPGRGSIGSMPLFGGGSPGFSGFGGMPGSPTAGSVPELANKP